MAPLLAPLPPSRERARPFWGPLAIIVAGIAILASTLSQVHQTSNVVASRWPEKQLDAGTGATPQQLAHLRQELAQDVATALRPQLAAALQEQVAAAAVLLKQQLLMELPGQLLQDERFGKAAAASADQIQQALEPRLQQLQADVQRELLSQLQPATHTGSEESLASKLQHDLQQRLLPLLTDAVRQELPALLQQVQLQDATLHGELTALHGEAAGRQQQQQQQEQQYQQQQEQEQQQEEAAIDQPHVSLAWQQHRQHHNQQLEDHLQQEETPAVASAAQLGEPGGDQQQQQQQEAAVGQHQPVPGSSQAADDQQQDGYYAETATAEADADAAAEREQEDEAAQLEAVEGASDAPQARQQLEVDEPAGCLVDDQPGNAAAEPDIADLSEQPGSEPSEPGLRLSIDVTNTAEADSSDAAEQALAEEEPRRDADATDSAGDGAIQEQHEEQQWQEEQDNQQDEHQLDADRLEEEPDADADDDSDGFAPSISSLEQPRMPDVDGGATNTSASCLLGDDGCADQEA